MRIDRNGNIGIGVASSSALFHIVDTAAGATLSSSSFLMESSKTIGTVASISAPSLTTGSLLALTVPASSTFRGPILVAQDLTGRVLASLSSGGRFSVRRDILSHGAFSSCTDVGTPQGGCLDYAESYPTSMALSAGDVVMIDAERSPHVVRADGSGMTVGVVATNPGVLISGAGVYTGTSAAAAIPGTVPVAMSGRVPVKVSGAPIAVGDHLSVSAAVPGTAEKATVAGFSLGVALEAVDPASCGSSCAVLLYVNYGYWAPNIASVTRTGTMLVSDDWDWPQVLRNFVHFLGALYNVTVEDGLVKTIRGVFTDVEADRVRARTVELEGDDGQPYCVRVVGGQLKSAPGTCDGIAPAAPAITPVPTPDTSPAVDVTPTPDAPPADASLTPTPEVASPTPEPTPDATSTPSPTPGIVPVVAETPLP